jgi:hypothetical protein
MRSCQVCHRRQQFSLFEPQTFRDKDTLKSVEKKLNQQRKQSRGNRALQNRLVIIQVKPADNWFSQPADADECRYGSGGERQRVGGPVLATSGPRCVEQLAESIA